MHLSTLLRWDPWLSVSGSEPCSMPVRPGSGGRSTESIRSLLPPPAQGEANLASDRGTGEGAGGRESPGQSIARCLGEGLYVLWGRG